MVDVISEPIFFEWDKGNLDKSLKKHGVTNEEAEEVFFDKGQNTSGNLVFHNENASGDPEKDKTFVIPIRFK